MCWVGFSGRLYSFVTDLQDDAPQTKLLEVRTNLSECVFEAPFNDSQPKSSTHALEKGFENAFGKVGPDFQNLRLGGVKMITKDSSMRCDVLGFLGCYELL
jgi:hypothetical protein